MTTRPNTAVELAALRSTVEAAMKAMERDRVDAKDQRDSMAKDISAIRANANKIDNRVATIEKDMQSVKPVIARVNSWQSMVMGGMIVFGLIGGMVAVFWDAVREKMVTLFTGMT